MGVLIDYPTRFARFSLNYSPFARIYYPGFCASARSFVQRFAPCLLPCVYITVGEKGSTFCEGLVGRVLRLSRKRVCRAGG